MKNTMNAQVFCKKKDVSSYLSLVYLKKRDFVSICEILQDIMRSDKNV